MYPKYCNYLQFFSYIEIQSTSIIFISSKFIKKINKIIYIIKNRNKSVIKECTSQNMNIKNIKSFILFSINQS